MLKEILLKDLISYHYYKKSWVSSVNYFIGKLVKNCHLVLLISAILLSSSFSAGRLADGREIEIRAEDILIVFLILISFLGFLISGKNKIEKPPLFRPIVALVVFGLFTTLINWFFGYLWIVRSFFYFLKEIEIFLLFFYIFYHIKSIGSAKFIVKFLIFLTLLNSFLVFYQLLDFENRKFGEYGTAAFCEWGVFPTASFFLLIFIFLINLFLYHFSALNISLFKKGVIGFLSLVPVIGIFGAMSKTVYLTFFFSFFLTLLFLFFRKKSFKLFIFIIIILIFISFIFLFTVKRIKASERLLNITSFSGIIENYNSARLNTIKDNINYAFENGGHFIFLIGLGKGFATEVHNQYVRNFIEGGIIGSILFLILIFIILKKSFKGFLKTRDGFLVGLSAGLLIATLSMLFMSMATEAFIVVKPSEIYWMFAALTFSVLTISIRKYDLPK